MRQTLASLTLDGWSARSRHPLNLRHVIMQDRLFAAIIPFDGDACPVRFRDGALVGLVFLPTNFVAASQLSGLWRRSLIFFLLAFARQHKH
jgi:hypothetical protein